MRPKPYQDFRKTSSMISRGTESCREVQKLIGTKSMVINALNKIHAKIIRRLRTTPSMATPSKGKFTLDLPQEVFRVVLNRIIQADGVSCRLQVAGRRLQVRISLRCGRSCIAFFFCCFTLTRQGKKEKKRKLIFP